MINSWTEDDYALAAQVLDEESSVRTSFCREIAQLVLDAVLLARTQAPLVEDSKCDRCGVAGAPLAYTGDGHVCKGCWPDTDKP